MAENERLVSLKGVCYSYPGGSGDVVSDISTSFDSGEVTFITGELGAGCSTLLLLAAGLVPRVMGGILGGEIDVLGNDPRHEKAGRALSGEVGILLSTPWTQLSGMSFAVRDEVAFGPSNLGWTRAEIEEAVRSSLTLLQIEHLEHRDPTRLSGGELQKVMLASVLAMNPRLLLLDEPAMELDPPAADTVYGLLPSLSEDKAVVIASTDIDRLAPVATRMIVLHRGTIVADGPPDEILRMYSGDGMYPTTSVGRVFQNAGVPDFPITLEEAVRRFSP